MFPPDLRVKKKTWNRNLARKTKKIQFVAVNAKFCDSTHTAKDYFLCDIETYQHIADEYLIGGKDSGGNKASY